MKLLHKQADEALIRAEFARLSRLNHPNLVRAHDLDRIQEDIEPGAMAGAQGMRAGRLFLILDLVQGVKPQAALEQSPEREREPLLRQVADEVARALAHLHGRGIVHHDVKPDNLLLDPQGKTTLIDLGLATGLSQGMPARGTLPYLAPEALAGGGDQRVDLYALGATLFELCTGTPPFVGENAQQVIERILQQTPRLQLPWLSPDMAELILALLSKDPLRRPLSAVSVSAELARMQGDHQTVAELSSKGALSPPAFVGREEELAVLAELLQGTPTHPRVVPILGDPGLGKSRLVREAFRRHRIQAAAGRCRPRKILSGSLSEVLQGAGARVELSGPALEDEVSLENLAVRVADELEKASGGDPLVIWLEGGDTDPLTAGLLQVLQRSAGDDASPGPHLLVLAEGAASTAAPGLADSQVQIRLEPLNLAETTRLVQSMKGMAVDDRLAARLHRLASGNPTLAAQMTRQWHGHGEQGLDLEGCGELESLYRQSRAWLDPGPREVLDALAIWGRPITASGLAALLNRAEQEIWPDLEAAAAHGDVVFEAGEAGLPSEAHCKAWRRALTEENKAIHGRAAKMLQGAAHPDLPRIAGHMLAADMAGAAKAGLQAAQALAQSISTGQAIELLRAVRCQGDDAIRAEAEPLLASLYIHTARYGEALSLLEAPTLPGEPPHGRALLRARALYRKGDHREAEAVLQGLQEVQEPAQRLEALWLQGRLLLRRGRPAQALSLIQPELEQGQDPPSEAAPLLEVLGLSLFYLGALDAAEDAFARGERALQGRARPRLLARFINSRGMTAFAAGRLQQAEEQYRRAWQLFFDGGDVHGRATCEVNLASTLMNRGYYGEALAQLTAAIRDLQRLARGNELASALCNLANLLLFLGDLESVGPTTQRAREILGRVHNHHLDGFLGMLDADLARRQGLSEDALAGYERALGAFERAGATREEVVCKLARADALTAAGRLEQSADTLEAVGQPAEEHEGPVALSRARLMLAGGPPAPQCAAALARHCARLEGQGASRSLWRAALVLGRLLNVMGRRQQARAALRQSRNTWEEIMNNTPDVYRKGMAEGDEDARALVSEWPSLASQEEEAGAPQETGRPGDHRMRRLLAINKRLNSEHRLPHLLELIMDTVIEFTEAERGFLLLAEGGGPQPQLSIKVARNIDQQSLQKTDELALSRSIAEQAAQNGEPVITIDAAADTRFAEAVSVSHLRLRSVLATPLMVKGCVVGTIYLDHRLKQGLFSDVEVSLVQDFADQAAIAIENARLLQENHRRQQEIQQLNEQLERKILTQQSELQEAREELRSSRQALQIRYDYRNIIGRTPRMLELFRLLDRVTETDLPVVIQGDSGTGKELVARAIHHNGQRSAAPFVGENCSAIPETLLESVLFGHVRGAFTGAEQDRLGLFEVASGGSLFLDEVGEMSPAMQTKLLRVLQDGEIRPVGSAEVRTTDVRIIAASNKDLSALVEAGRFREDLFYRLNVIQIQIPPLRSRREDIPLLVDHFLAQHGSGSARRVDPDALAMLVGHGWPGNVRELENEIMRAAALGGEVIGVDDLSPGVRGGIPLSLSDPDDMNLRSRVEHLEREMITRALAQTRGNKTQAARLLGLSRYGLLKKIKRYKLEK